eukprot:173681-Pyramimonas_sp.AAC.1
MSPLGHYRGVRLVSLPHSRVNWHTKAFSSSSDSFAEAPSWRISGEFRRNIVRAPWGGPRATIPGVVVPDHVLHSGG